jgi:hypothetical protein
MNYKINNKKYVNIFIYYNNNRYLIIIKLFICIFFILVFLISKKFYIKNNKKIGIIGLPHHQNIGNILLKYSIFITLRNKGFKPYIIGKHFKKDNITILKKLVNLRIISNFSEIKEQDYNILMVNSDQTWRKWNKDFYDIAFLKFAKNWRVHKFVYATSIGFNKWKFNKSEENIATNLLKNFTGISVREKGLSRLIKKHLGIKAYFVLDPTLLIDKKYYLKIIENYRYFPNLNEDFILTYKLKHMKVKKKMSSFINKARKELNIKIYNVDRHENQYIEKFIYRINNCKAVITDSYHGTVFSIIFNKPFITFKRKNDERLKSLSDLLEIKGRIVDYEDKPDLSLLMKPLSFNTIRLNRMKLKSLDFIKNNLVFN